MTWARANNITLANTITWDLLVTDGWTDTRTDNRILGWWYTKYQYINNIIIKIYQIYKNKYSKQMHHHLCILIQQLKGNLGNLTRFFSTSVWMQMWEWMQRMNPNRTQVQYEARNTTQESRFSARSLLAWINGNQQAGSSLHISEAYITTWRKEVPQPETPRRLIMCGGFHILILRICGCLHINQGVCGRSADRPVATGKI